MVQVYPISEEKAREIATSQHAKSLVGHDDTARVFSNILYYDVPMNRETVALEDRDALVVGQYSGPRLEPGTVLLPDGASISWTYVLIFIADPKARSTL